MIASFDGFVYVRCRFDFLEVFLPLFGCFRNALRRGRLAMFWRRAVVTGTVMILHTMVNMHTFFYSQIQVNHSFCLLPRWNLNRFKSFYIVKQKEGITFVTIFHLNFTAPYSTLAMSGIEFWHQQHQLHFCRLKPLQ